VYHGRKSEMNSTSVAIAVVRSACYQRFISNEKDELLGPSLTATPYVVLTQDLEVRFSSAY
jgi:hypothetical protein